MMYCIWWRAIHISYTSECLYALSVRDELRWVLSVWISIVLRAWLRNADLLFYVLDPLDALCDFFLAKRSHALIWLFATINHIFLNHTHIYIYIYNIYVEELVGNHKCWHINKQDSPCFLPCYPITWRSSRPLYQPAWFFCLWPIESHAHFTPVQALAPDLAPPWQRVTNEQPTFL